jgi:tetratricopeptide (TPR) repeat protein
MFGGGMFGDAGDLGGQAGGKTGLYEDEEMDQDRPSAKTTSSTTTEPPKKPAEPAKPNLTESQREAEREKELGNEAYKKKDFDAALTHYEKAIELDPTNITYMTNKAAVYYEKNMIDECIQTCERGIEIGRENKAEYSLIAK